MPYNEEKKHKDKKAKEYPHKEENVSIASEPAFVYGRTLTPATMRTIDLMGMEGKRDFAAIKNEKDFIDLIRTGIPKQAMTHLMQVTDMSLTEMASIVHTSDRTLRRYGPQQKLSQEQSERMIELAKLYSRGETVFGSIEKFKNWMNTTLLPFGNKKPKEYLDTSIGIGMIMDELGRIEHGIFA
jgi:putative toxin-antitoxin system antitoxin component (TIGR02293 family)